MKTKFFAGFLCVILSWTLVISGCSLSPTQESESATGADVSAPLKVYYIGHENDISYGEENWTEYSFPVTLGLERTGYMPGYAQGNPMYQALLDYQEETGIEIEATGLGSTGLIMRQIKEDAAQGKAPDVVIILKQFNDMNTGTWEELLAEGAFADMQSYIHLTEEEYYMPVMHSGRYQDGQYLVPLLFNINGYITSEEFLRQAGQEAPEASASFQELLHWLTEICIAMQGNTSKVALYEGTTIWEHYILNVLSAAAGPQNLENKLEITEETIQSMLELMQEFLKQDFQTVSGYETHSYEENLSSTSALYDRFNFGPMYAEDPEYKRNMLGILLDGGYQGVDVGSSFIMQAYTMQTYYEEMNETMVWGAIPMETEARQYAACVRALAFCPAQSNNQEGAGRLLQYLLTYAYPPEIGIPVNRATAEAQISALTQTSTELYIQPRYDPFATEEVQEEKFNQSKVWFQPMKPELADQLLSILNQVAGASLPYEGPMQVLEDTVGAMFEGKMQIDEAVAAIQNVWDQYWSE